MTATSLKGQQGPILFLLVILFAIWLSSSGRLKAIQAAAAIPNPNAVATSAGNNEAADPMGGLFNKTPTGTTPPVTSAGGVKLNPNDPSIQNIPPLPDPTGKIPFNGNLQGLVLDGINLI